MIQTVRLAPEVENFNSILKYHYTYGSCMMTDLERRMVGYLVLKSDTGRPIFEFGTWRGCTTAYLGETFPGKSIFTLDIKPSQVDCSSIDSFQRQELLPESEIGIEFRIKPHLLNIHQILTDSVLFDVNSIKESLPLDMVLIDGNHTAEYGLSDFAKAQAMLRPGGIIACHDFNPAHVVDCTKPNPGDAATTIVSSTPLWEWLHVHDTAIVYTTV